MAASTTAFYTYTEQKLGEYAKEYGYGVISQPIPDVQSKLRLSQYYPDFCTMSGVVALACDVEKTTWLEECKNADIPIVLIHDSITKKQLQDKGRVSAIWEDLGALEELVVHLIEEHDCRGLRVIAADPKIRPYRQRKIDKICDTAKDHGVMVNKDPDDKESHVFLINQDTIEQGAIIAERCIVNDKNVDAVICLSDDVALGVLRIAEQHERYDLHISGYDDVPGATYHNITSISQHRARRAKKAIEEIFEAQVRELADYPRCFEMPTTLFKRASSCPECLAE